MGEQLAFGVGGRREGALRVGDLVITGLSQFDHLIDQAVQVHGAPVEGFAPGEDHQLIDQGSDPIDLPDDEPGGAFASLVAHFALEEFCGSADAAEGVLDLVGYSSRDLPVGGKAIALGCFVAKVRERRAVS